MTKEQIKQDKIDAKLLKEKHLFQEMPVWKSLLKMGLPAVFLMLVFGSYTFADSIMAINFGDDSYKDLEAAHPLIKSGVWVRLFMSSAAPITIFMTAFTMMFGQGLSTRFSINIGAKREDRAISTLKTSFQVAMGLSLLLIPILLLTAKPWIRSQFNEDPAVASIIEDKGYEYVWLMIVALPLQMFNQLMSSLYRAEGKIKIMMISLITPVVLNILLDWVFLDPLGMGVEGSGYATVLSWVFTTVFFMAYIFKGESKRLIFKNMFGKTGFAWITLIGVILIGLAPFLRNMAQSITQTVEMHVMQKVSDKVYGNAMMMQNVSTGVFPIFGLMFPLLFGMTQAGTPLAAYNYGAKDMARVKKTIFWVVIYSTIIGILIWVLSIFILYNPLADSLQVHDMQIPILSSDTASISKLHEHGINPIAHTTVTESGAAVQYDVFNMPLRDKARKMLAIMMLMTPIFGLVLGAMTLFNSVDRILLSILAASLRGIILLIPFLYIFQAIAVVHYGDPLLNMYGTHSVFSEEYLFWWFYPVLGLVAIAITTVLMVFTMKRLDRHHATLEDRIEKINNWFIEKKKRRA